MSLNPPDFAGTRVLKAAYDPAHRFEIELGQQRCRTDEINEHDGELAALGLSSYNPFSRTIRWLVDVGRLINHVIEIDVI